EPVWMGALVLRRRVVPPLARRARESDDLAHRLLRDLRDDAGTHRPPPLPDRKPQLTPHRHRRDQVDRHRHVVPPHHHLHPRWHVVHARAMISRTAYSVIALTAPAPTVRPPSRIANRNSFSIATGVIRSIVIVTLSPGITISTPAGNVTTPVTSVVRR